MTKYTSLVGNYKSVDILSRNLKYSFKYQLIRRFNTFIIESKEAFASENFKGVISQLGHLSIQARQKQNHTHTHTCIFILEKNSDELSQFVQVATCCIIDHTTICVQLGCCVLEKRRGNCLQGQKSDGYTLLSCIKGQNY